VAGGRWQVASGRERPPAARESPAPLQNVQQCGAVVQVHPRQRSSAGPANRKNDSRPARRGPASPAWAASAGPLVLLQERLQFVSVLQEPDPLLVAECHREAPARRKYARLSSGAGSAGGGVRPGWAAGLVRLCAGQSAQCRGRRSESGVGRYRTPCRQSVAPAFVAAGRAGSRAVPGWWRAFFRRARLAPGTQSPSGFPEEDPCRRPPPSTFRLCARQGMLLCIAVGLRGERRIEAN